VRSSILSFALLLLLALVALAPDPHLDLPVTKDKLPPPESITGTLPPPPPDDPHDEPPPLFFGEEIDTRTPSLIYVLDFSSSMDYRKRIDTLKTEFARSVNGLSPAFRFNVVTYGCWTKRWQGESVPASRANKAAGIAWVNGQQPQGGTATGPAVALGLQEKTNYAIVLLTDGDPNCGCEIAPFTDCHRRMIRNANSQGATINVFGIAARGEYRAFCQGVAAESGGGYTDVPDR
jgi:hypothetical protein